MGDKKFMLKKFMCFFRPLNQRKLEKAVAVSGVCSGVPEESSGKVPGRLLEKLFPNRAMLQILGLKAPNHKSQIASDLKSRSPNRKNFTQIAVPGRSNRTFKSRDL